VKVNLIGDFNQFQSTLLVCATGTGKTQIFVEAMARMPGRTLVLAHRRELIDQAKARFEQLTGLSVGVEMAGQTVLDGSPLPDVVIASVQTMQRRLQKFKPDDFGKIVVDEAHRILGGSYTAPVAFCLHGIGLVATESEDCSCHTKRSLLLERLV
jgi:superfamily II DNA or RNA helicase